MSNQKIGQEASRRAKQGGAKRTIAGSGSAPGEQGGTVSRQVQDALDQQVMRGARTMAIVAHSARRAAGDLENDAPQIAGLVRGMADRIEEYSRDLEHQSVTDIYQSASDFTRRQPAVVFGIAALAGFLALRTLRSGQTNSSSPGRTSRPQGEELHGS
jgi:hypothetical protein